MQALNSAERSTSIVTFIAVYVLVMAIPLYLGYMMGKNKGAPSSSGADGPEQKQLVESLQNIQAYIDRMKNIDEQQPNGAGASSLWQSWVANAEGENEKFKSAISQLRNLQLSGTRKDIRNSAVIYLERLQVERAARIDLEKSLRGVRNESAEIQRLKAENEQLKIAKQGLENTIRTKDQIIASASRTNNGGGGAQNSEAIANLKWELLFCDANAQKSQADVLSPCNQAPKRKQLYSVAKVNFQKISNGSVPSYTLKKLAQDKVKEIDQLMAKL